MSAPGEKILELLRTECDEYLICAPFIKVAPLKALLSCIPGTEGAMVAVYTRWFAAEVAAGVTDLEVFELCAGRPGTTLYLVDSLHAKLYRADEHCLVGSANVTDKALGWVYPSNTELILEASSKDTPIVSLENRLRIERRVASAAERDKIRLKVGELGTIYFSDAQNALDNHRATSRWLPKCRKPELVFRIYQSVQLPNELEEMRLAAAEDLRYLNPPLGLSKEQFKDAVRELLRTLPVFEELITLVNRDELRNGIGRKVLDKIYAVNDADFESERYWSNIREWLIYFFGFRAEPREYRIVAGTQDD